MERKILKLNSIYDDVSGYSFAFKVDLEYEEVKKVKKCLYKQFTEEAIACYMQLTGDNFLLKHGELRKFLNNYRLANFLKVTKIVKSDVVEYPLTVEKTDNTLTYIRDINHKIKGIKNPSKEAEECIKTFGFEELNKQD